MSDIQKAAKILSIGGVIVFPTDTVYGIGAVFDNDKAQERIYKIKGTPKRQKFPILVSSLKQVENIAEVGPKARELIEKYWPGALTIVLKSKDKKEKLGFRRPNSKIVEELINLCNKPIVGTSANIHGKKTPESFEQLDEKIIRAADFVIKGKCRLMKESTVVDASSSTLKVLRVGAILL